MFNYHTLDYNLKNLSIMMYIQVLSKRCYKKYLTDT